MRLSDTAEFALLLAICRWPYSPHVQEAVRTSAAQVTDWPLFLQMVARQRVWAMAQGTLQNAGVALPDAVDLHLKHKAQKIVQQNLRFTAEVVRVQRNMNNAGVAAVFLKGVVLADRVYGTITLKHGKDIDICIRPDQVDAAWHCLEQMGYRQQWLPENASEALRHRLMRHKKEMSFLHMQNSAEVELHWRLLDNAAILHFPQPDDVLSLPFAGVSVYQFTDKALFLYLALHGAQHGWYRLKWLADFNAFLTGKNCADLYRYATERHMGLVAGYGLMLCHRYLGKELPVDLLRKASGWRIRSLCRITHWMLAGRYALKEPIQAFMVRMALHPVMFLQCQSVASLLKQCTEPLFSHADMQKYPLPRGLFFLYPVLRFPLWCVRRLRCQKKRPHQ